MNEFMLFIREDVSRVETLSEEAFQAEIEEFTAWVEEMAKTGNFVSGDPLESTGRYILKDTISSDGPFIESKEAISGYVIIRAKDIEEAVSLAQKSPIFKYNGLIELRPIHKI
ncbi:MAG: YciI family protein [Bacteroidota bacterium]